MLLGRLCLFLDREAAVFLVLGVRKVALFMREEA